MVLEVQESEADDSDRMNYWLLFYDDMIPSLSIVDYGTREQVMQTFHELTKKSHYYRQWISDGMTWLDYGSHTRFFKIYPAINLFEEDTDGLQSRDSET